MVDFLRLPHQLDTPVINIVNAVDGLYLTSVCWVEPVFY